MEAARVRVLAAMGGGVIQVAQLSSLMTEFQPRRRPGGRLARGRPQLWHMQPLKDS